MTDFEYLRDLMQAEAEAAERLLSVLGAEEQALAQRQTSEIERLAAEKKMCLAELEPFGSKREALLTAAGLTNDRAGFESLLQRADGGPRAELTRLWEALQANLTECRGQNLKNGQILEANRHVVHKLLNVLLGDNGTELYGRDGSTSPSRSSHTFVKA